jgi:hypothetical protein
MPIRRRFRRAFTCLLSASILFAAAASPARADQVVPTDLIVQGSTCSGLGCIDNEPFGANEALRLKQDNIRLDFLDTSGAPGDPFNDWRLLVNEVANGGLNMFGIEDATAGRIPFLLEAGAPANALRIDSSGDVGLGLANPTKELHLSDDDTPTVRLEQTNAGGFSAQTWDVAGNEANFFVRDLTGGSRLPFRIRPGAPTSSIDIAANGNVGLGIQNPTQAVHVQRNNGTARILVEDTGGSGDQTLLDLDGNTSAFARFAGGPGSLWRAGSTQAGNFTFASGAGPETRLTLEPGGDLSTTGSVDQLAAAASRENVSAANPGQLLEGLRALQLERFEFPADPDNRVHLGPTGANFATAFGLGGGDSVGVADLAGAALGAAQALDARVTSIESQLADTSGSAQTQARIDQLQQQVDAANARAASADQRAAAADKRARKALKKIKKLKG